MVLRTWDSVGRVNNLGIGLLVAEGCLVCGLAALYEWMLLTQVARQRYGLYSVFLVIPTGFLRALASKHVQVDGEDDNDSDSEAGDDPGKQQAQQGKQQEGDKSGEGDKVGNGTSKPRKGHAPGLVRLPCMPSARIGECGQSYI